jgi:hypothetical protein
MGYRSDVTIIFYARGDSNDAGRNALLKLWFDENYPVMVAKDEWGATIRQKEDAIIIDYDDVKWYEGYDHVKAVTAAIGKFDDTFRCGDEEGHYAHEFLRVGEEDADIETERSDWNDHLLYVSRSIRIDMEGID